MQCKVRQRPFSNLLSLSFWILSCISGSEGRWKRKSLYQLKLACPPSKRCFVICAILHCRPLTALQNTTHGHNEQVISSLVCQEIRNISGSDQIRCWSVGTYATANMMGHKGGDGFLPACMRVMDFYTCCSFGKPPMTDFSASCFWWWISSWRASILQRSWLTNNNGTYHWVKFAVEADASCQFRHTQHHWQSQRQYLPHPHQQHSCRICAVASNLESAISVCNARLVPDWNTKKMVWRVSPGLSWWQNQCLWPWQMSWQTHQGYACASQLQRGRHPSYDGYTSVMDQPPHLTNEPFETHPNTVMDQLAGNAFVFNCSLWKGLSLDQLNKSQSVRTSCVGYTPKAGYAWC